MKDRDVIFIYFMMMVIVIILMVVECMISRRISEAQNSLEKKIDDICSYHTESDATITDATITDATITDATIMDATETDSQIETSVGNAFDKPSEAQECVLEVEGEEMVGEATKTDSEASKGHYMGSYELTAYIATGNPCADGVYPQEGWTVACNDSRLWHRRIRIEGYGEYYVHDTGGMASNVIDVFVGSYNEAIQFGRKTAEVYIIE